MEIWFTDGVFRLLSPHSIWGSSNNNAYIGGSAGKIWHFDGNSWSEVATLTKDGHDDIVFDNIWGGSYNDFYIMGAYHNDNGAPNNSVITHFNDNIWTSFDTDNIIGIVERLYKNKTDGKIYLRTNRIGGGNILIAHLFINTTKENIRKSIVAFGREVYRQI